MRHTFTLNSPPGVNEWTVQFKQHLTIPAEAKIQFNFINLKLTNSALWCAIFLIGDVKCITATFYKIGFERAPQCAVF